MKSAIATAAPPSTVSERLGDHVVGTRFADLSSAVVERVKDILIYDLSLAFAGRSTDAGRQAVALAHELSGGTTSSTIVGHRRGASLLDAVFAHSELLGDEDELHLTTKLRVGRVAQPVVWVLGEHQRSSGRELIVALAVAYDVASRLAEPLAMAGDYVRMPHKCAFGAFGPAAAAARLLRQDRPAASRTIARAAHFGMGNNEGYADAFVFGLMARNGVMAALLPASMRTTSLRAIESPYGLYAALFGGPPAGLDASLDTLGTEFAVLGATTKPYPGSGSHFAAIDAARELVDAGVRAPDVAALVVVLPDEFRGRFGKREAVIDDPTARDADLIMSLRLRLAAFFVGGVFVARPTRAHFQDPGVQAALVKITLAFEPRPEQYSRVEVRTTDGRTLIRERVFTASASGDWSAWLRRDGERFLSSTRLAELERRLRNLEDVADVGDVLRLTVPDGEEVT